MLGFSRRRRERREPAPGWGPRGKRVGDSYIPAPEELESAVSIARSVDDWLPQRTG